MPSEIHRESLDLLGHQGRKATKEILVLKERKVIRVLRA